MNGVWCCPVKVKAAIRTSATRTALVLTLFAIFYPKEEIKGRRLHKLDQDVIEAITGMYTQYRLWRILMLNSIGLMLELL